MSFIAGMVDVTSWLTLSGLFAAHITGNLVVVAADLVRGESPNVSQVLAIPMFVIAVVVSYLIVERLGNITRASSIALLSLQFILLSSTLLTAVLSLNAGGQSKKRLLLAGMLAVSAMAVQNALLHLTCKRVPTTAVMTGNVVAATIALMELLKAATRSEGKEQWKATWPLLAGFFVGCLTGAVSVRALGNWSWSVPTAASLMYIIWFSVTDRSLVNIGQRAS